MKILKCINQSIDWLGSYPLNPFEDKLEELKTVNEKRRILILTRFRFSLWTIHITYTWIGFILERIDNDLYNHLEFNKKLHLVDKEIKITADELPPSNPHLTKIDIISLTIFLNILMDDVTHFLYYIFIGESIPETNSFADLKKTVSNFEGNELEELNRIIQNTAWYRELKDLRDKPIVHHGLRNSAIGIKGNEIGIYLHYAQNQKFMSNREIDLIADNVRFFLIDLNEYLCKNFDYLPLNGKKKNSSE